MALVKTAVLLVSACMVAFLVVAVTVCVPADGRGVGQRVKCIVEPLPLQGLGVPT